MSDDEFDDLEVDLSSAVDETLEPQKAPLKPPKKIRVDYDGQSFYPFEPGSPYRSPDSLDEKTQKWLKKALTKGKFYDENADDPYDALSGVEQRRLAHGLLGTYDDSPRPGMRPKIGPTRWVVPGLWRWGYIPMLGGNPKAGKSTFAVDLVASVMNGPWDKTRFLDYFDVTDVTKAELESRSVWYINAENPPDALEEAMLKADLKPWLDGDSDSGLIVEHLQDLGGPRSFDFTDPEMYDWWEFRFGSNDPEPPLLVIVDGLTAILGGSAARYGPWFARFRDLMKSLKIPNALVLGHSTLKGDHLGGGFESQAGGDGNWNLQRLDSGKRIFSQDPRLGAPEIEGLRVRLDPDGRLRVGGNSPSATPVTANGSAQVASTPAPNRNLKAEVLKAVTEAYAAGVQPSGSKIRQAVHGRNEDIDEALTGLVNSGQIEQFKATGPSGGGGFAYRPVSRAT